MRDVNYAHKLGVLAPEPWLLKHIAALISVEEMRDLRAAYDMHKRHYNRCSILNKWARWVQQMERQPGDDRAMRVAKWRAILADPKAYVFSEEAK